MQNDGEEADYSRSFISFPTARDIAIRWADFKTSVISIAETGVQMNYFDTVKHFTSDEEEVKSL